MAVGVDMGRRLATALVLIVEDEPDLAESLELHFRHDGFRTERATTGERALALAHAARPDLILLDLGLPGIDGIEVLRRLRSGSSVPVVILTARAEEVDEVVGLGLGADDYLVKPVTARRLLAHARAVLHRVHGAAARGPDVVRVGALDVDGYRMEARLGGIPLGLTLTEFRLLQHLARTPGRAIARTELCEAALPEGDSLERAVDLHVVHLRRKLAAAGAGTSIATIRGVGYALVERAPA